MWSTSDGIGGGGGSDDDDVVDTLFLKVSWLRIRFLKRFVVLHCFLFSQGAVLVDRLFSGGVCVFVFCFDSMKGGCTQ